MNTKPISLRAHHFLCLLTYAGKGYNAEFVACFDQIVAAIQAGVPVQLIEGPDAICAPLCHTDNSCTGFCADTPHCYNASVQVRDRQARVLLQQYFTTVLSMRLEVGEVGQLSAETIKSLRKAYQSETFSMVCAGCEWQGLCKGIAETGFALASLR